MAFGEVYRVRFLFNNEPSDEAPQKLIVPFTTETNLFTSFPMHEKHLRGRLNQWVSSVICSILADTFKNCIALLHLTEFETLSVYWG